MLTNHLVFSLQSASHEGQPCNEFMAYAMAHKGKATSDVSFSQTDPPEAYSNPSVHTRIHDYTAMGKGLHGDTWDPATVPLYGEAIMRAGGGKKHGRYWLADSVVDTASTPNLSQLRARIIDSTPPIRPRLETSVATMQALQVISVSFVFRSFVLIGPDGGREEEAGGDRGDVEGEAADVAVGAGEYNGS